MKRFIVGCCILAALVALGAWVYDAYFKDLRESARILAAVAATPSRGDQPAQDDVLAHRLYSSGQIREMQQLLQQAGFDPGAVDGKWGARTRRALVAFQRAQGLPADGEFGAQTWVALRRYAATAPGVSTR